MDSVKWHVERGREYYEQRVVSSVRCSTDYYQEAVVSMLGLGDAGNLRV